MWALMNFVYHFLFVFFSLSPPYLSLPVCFVKDFSKANLVRLEYNDLVQTIGMTSCIV